MGWRFTSLQDNTPKNTVILQSYLDMVTNGPVKVWTICPDFDWTKSGKNCDKFLICHKLRICDKAYKLLFTNALHPTWLSWNYVCKGVQANMSVSRYRGSRPIPPKKPGSIKF